MLVLSIFLKGLYQDYVKGGFVIFTSYVVAGLILCVLSVLHVPPILRLGYAFITFFTLPMLLFGVKSMNAFYSAMLLCVINIIVDYAISGVIVFFGIAADTLEVYGNNRVLFIVVAKLVQFFLIFLVIRLSNRKKSRGSLIEAVPLLMCQVFSVFVCYLMYLAVHNSATQITWSFIIGAIGILYINITIFIYVERIKEVGEIKRQNELADLQYKLKVDYFNQIKEDQANTRALWHDIKKYLNTMNELICRNEFDHARECITQVEGLFGGLGNVVDVGNTVISAVLNASIQRARRMNISTDLDIRVRPDLNISAADLSVIIGNTVDNAVEACALLEEGDKEISIQLIQKGALLYYEIKNPYKKRDDETELEDNGRKLHGYGLKNVKRCIDKYNGTMSIYSCETHFVVSIHMNIPAGQTAAQLVS
jgi:sensor histidine kinase YesM